MRLPRKYVVFKADDWDEYCTKVSNTYGDMAVDELPRLIEDFVVIRYQDFFAAQSFYTYSGQIQTVIEILDYLLRNNLSPITTLEQLKELADQFSSAGDEATDFQNKKIPD